MSIQRLSFEGAQNRDIGTVTPVDATFIGATHDLGPLLAWQAALAKRDTTPVDILCIGTSVTHGLNASPIVSKRWTNLLIEKLRANLQPAGIVGGVGYIAASETDIWTVVGGISAWYGLGRNARFFDSAGSLTLTFTGTGIDLWYIGTPISGVFSWEIDGGGATNITTTLGATASVKNTDIRGLTNSDHTLVLRWVSGPVTIEGATVLNGDESLGLRMFNGGRGGGLSSERAALSYVSGNQPSYWLPALDTLNPDLVIIEFGANDWPQNVPSATLDANIRTIISAINSIVSPVPSILLLALFERGNVGTPTEGWEKYVDAMYRIAKSHSNVQLIDFNKISQRHDYAITDSLGIVDTTDKVHLTNAGAQWFADEIAKVLWDGGVDAKTIPAAYTQTYATATRTHAAETSAATATTGATNITPYGYTTAAQADAVVANLNAVRADLANLKQLVNSLIDDAQARRDAQ